MTEPDFVARLAGVLIPVLLAVALWRFVRRRRRVAAKLGDPWLVARSSGGELLRVPWGRAALVLLASSALGAALWTSTGRSRDDSGWAARSVVMVFDASLSMLAADVQPNRLKVARGRLRAMLGALPKVSLGIVIFGGRSYVLTPPTPDPGAVELYLDALGPEMVTQTGSALVPALRQGVSLLAASDLEPESGALLLVTDGDASETPLELRPALELARDLAVPVHVLAVGTRSGAPVPAVDLLTGRREGYQRNPSGEVAVSKLGEATLREVAATTNGRYVAATDPDAVMQLSEALGVRGEGAALAQLPFRRIWLVLTAVLLLLVESLLASRGRGRR